MTFLTPHQNGTTKQFLLLLFALVVLGGVLYIFEYNMFVNARFELGNLKKSLTELQTANADLKNRLYAVLDPVKLTALATERGLVLEKKPQYVTKQWVSDSTR